MALGCERIQRDVDDEQQRQRSECRNCDLKTLLLGQFVCERETRWNGFDFYTEFLAWNEFVDI